MRFYLKVIQNNKLVFRTIKYQFLTQELTNQFVEEFKKTIKDDCTVYLHEVVVKDGVEIKDWREKL